MGTIKIEEYTTVGGQGAVDCAPVADLSTCIATTEDTSTSTTAETLTLKDDTRFVVITSLDGDHRASAKDSAATDKYGTIPAGTSREYAVRKYDRTLAYRLNA